MERSTSEEQAYAEDVTDLREAQRMIALLRHTLKQQTELTYYADGEFTIFLDDEHTNMVMTLFEQQRLVAGQDPASELHDALSEFVGHCLDTHWEMHEIGQRTFRALPG